MKWTTLRVQLAFKGKVPAARSVPFGPIVSVGTVGPPRFHSHASLLIEFRVAVITAEWNALAKATTGGRRHVTAGEIRCGVDDAWLFVSWTDNVSITETTRQGK